MEYLFALAGLSWIFFGALTLGLSLDGTHKIVACLAISFGVLFLGLSALLRHLKTMNASWQSTQVPSGPPPIPMEYETPIEDAIDGVRTAVRVAEGQEWIRSFQRWADASRSETAAQSLNEAAPHYPAYPAPARYFTKMLPPPSPAAAERSDIDYDIEQLRSEVRKISH